MSDEGNVRVFNSESGSGDEGYFLYTEHDGAETYKRVRKALLKCHSVAGDLGKVGRAIFQEMVGDDQNVDSFAITPEAQTTKRLTVSVDVGDKEVSWVKDPEDWDGDHKWSFGQYVESQELDKQWQEAHPDPR